MRQAASRGGAARKSYVSAMSYCRWGNGDLYIYADVQGGLTCSGCRLLHGAGRWRDFHCTTRSEMLRHIESHRLAGHRVLEEVIARLRAEIAAIGDTA